MNIENDVIICPGCGKEQTISVYPVVNKTLEPELREKVLSGELFAFTCEGCGYQGYAGYPFLYQDDETANGFMIYLEPECQDRVVGFEGEEEDKEIHSEKIFRLVSDMNTLREKIYIFEAGLDDRVMELFKVLTMTKLQESSSEKEGDDQDNVPDTLLFTRLDEENEEKIISLAAFSDGRYLGVLELPFSLYDSCVVTGEPIWNVVIKDCPMIDSEWIVERLKVEEESEE